MASSAADIVASSFTADAGSDAPATDDAPLPTEGATVWSDDDEPVNEMLTWSDDDDDDDAGPKVPHRWHREKQIPAEVPRVVAEDTSTGPYETWRRQRASVNELASAFTELEALARTAKPILIPAAAAAAARGNDEAERKLREELREIESTHAGALASLEAKRRLVAVASPAEVANDDDDDDDGDDDSWSKFM